ncbi:MAG: septation ring formation regulator EzrA [Spirochaetaceae bacterium]|nr:septation ring formation regulator EzrA [Spirochaetaceae bacterium]
MDPEIAALLGTGGEAEVPALYPERDFAAIFDEDMGETKSPEETEVNLQEKGFPEITKRFETSPHNGFADPNYYKIALSGEGDIAQRVHTILQKFVNTKDPKDRSVFRQQFSTAYWDFLAGVARKTSGKIPDPKKYLLRFGILHPTLLTADDRTFFSKIVVNNELSVPIYYLDEWFKAVGIGEVRNSATDEVRIAKNSSQIHLQQLLDKAVGKRDGARALLKAKDDERTNLEKFFKDRIETITEHFPLDGLPGINACYTDAQKRAFTEIQEVIKQLFKTDRDMEVFLRDLYEAEEDVKNLQEKVEQEGGALTVDVRAVDTEFETVRQMAKMTIGRQGNHFPILTHEYFRCSPNDIGFRENVVSILSWVESVDPEAFRRAYKNRLNRIVPYVVLLPTYGDLGVCWEPFERMNRATSRGRIALPMYPKNLIIAALSAVADLRWQVAKEKASYYWMEEGLTGNYYQWFSAKKLKGDLKEYFIQDYIIWMTKESEGIQKLEKEVRGIFWRYMPFSQAIKEKLKTRSYVYQDLYQRDLNRAMSDGY